MDYKPSNQERDSAYNREPGIVLVPGSNFVKEVAKYEQNHSKFTIGTSPGNPYVKREFPMMIYRAEDYNGKIVCMAAEPVAIHFKDSNELQAAQDEAKRFTRSCQRIVGDEIELQKARENGWREGPAEAVEYLEGRRRGDSRATAEREFADRNMGEPAKREIRAEREARGGEHIPEMPRQPVKPTVKRRGRPKGSKNKKKPAA